MYNRGINFFYRFLFVFVAFFAIKTNACYAQGLDFLGGAPPPPAVSKEKKEPPKPLLGGAVKKDSSGNKGPLSAVDNKKEEKKSSSPFAAKKDDAVKKTDNKPFAPKTPSFGTPAVGNSPFPSKPLVNNTVNKGAGGFNNIPQTPTPTTTSQPASPPRQQQRRAFGSGLRAMSPSQKVLGAGASNVFKSMADLERKNAMLTMELEKERLKSEIEAVVNARKLQAQKEKERQDAIVSARKLKEDTAMKQLLMEEEALLHKILMEEEQLKQAILAQREVRKENAFQRKKELEEIKLEQLKLEKEIKEEEWTRKQEEKEKELKAQLEKEAAEAKNKIQTLSQRLKAAKMADMDSIRGLQLKSVGVPQDINSKMFGSSSGKNDLPKFGGSVPSLGNVLGSGKRGGKTASGTLPSAGGGAAAGIFDWNSIDGASPVVQEKPASQIYVVTEVRGVAGKLVAKLLNDKGMNFFARRGTVLTTGHTVLAVEKTHVLVAKGGKKEVLGFGSGGSVVPLAGTSDDGDNKRGLSSRRGRTTRRSGGRRAAPRQQAAPPQAAGGGGLVNNSRGGVER